MLYNYLGTLHASIVLQNGENASHNLTAICGESILLCWFAKHVNPNAYDFSYSTNNGTSSLTINAAMPQGTTNSVYLLCWEIYMSGVTQNLV